MKSAAPNSQSTARTEVPSLPESYRTIPVPKSFGFWRKLLAFSGPGYLVAVGYMDPGNWGTDLAGGAQFKYGLLWVVAMASFMALILQVISCLLYTSPSPRD